MPHFKFTYIIDNGYSKQKQPITNIICADSDKLVIARYKILKKLNYNKILSGAYKAQLINGVNIKELINEINAFNSFIPSPINQKKYYQIKYAMSTIKFILRKPIIIDKPRSIIIDITILNYTL
jgi:hypothetical protein